MDQVSSSPSSASADPSIYAINQALLARYREQQATAKAAQATEPTAGAFASAMGAVQREQGSSPVSLLPQSSSGAGSPATTSNLTQKTDSSEACSGPKISRSARMACAEKATHVSYEEDDFSLGDLVDLLNPLQHIPLIGTLYRELTGDEIKPEVQIAGSALFGLATGSLLVSTAVGVASAAFESSTGEEPTIQLARSFFGEESIGVPDPLTEPKIVVADAGHAGQEASAETSAPDRDAVAPVVAEVAPAGQEAPAQAQEASLRAGAKETGTSVTAATSLPSLMATSGGIRIGNTVHPLPSFRSANRAVAASAKAQVKDTETQTQTAQAEPTGQGQEATSLGVLMQEQAQAHAQGEALSPELISDLMTRALEKYKMAQNTDKKDVVIQ
ncbi:MAG: hypothetical protein AB7E52_05900 [Bdellovibrionales bacterium]